MANDRITLKDISYGLAMWADGIDRFGEELLGTEHSVRFKEWSDGIRNIFQDIELFTETVFNPELPLEEADEEED